MHEKADNTRPRAKGNEGAHRRALVVAEHNSPVAAVEKTLSLAGYETRLASAADAARAAFEFAPDVIIITPSKESREPPDEIRLARRLRAEATTYALPVVILFSEETRALREAALALGVDDFFSLTTTPSEMLARIDSLFWRAEAGRRALAADQRSEIDNFIFLLEGVRADAAEGMRGALALVEHAGTGGARTVSEAHGFLKLNLRRADAVAFYGPDTLLAYLPGRDSARASEMLSALREEFLRTRNGADFAFGVVSFPEDGVDVELLIERAEKRLEEAKRVSVSGQGAQADEGDAVANEKGLEDVLAGARTSREERMLDALESATASLVRASSDAKEDGGAAQKSAPHVKSAGDSQRVQPSRGPRRLLLVVSDAARMAQLNLLIRSAAYEVRTAFDGQQALSLLRIERPDLVIVDGELKEMSGAEMLRRLRKQQGGRLKIPALLLLRDGGDDARREAEEIGARPLASVPYNPEELLESIRTAGGSEPI